VTKKARDSRLAGVAHALSGTAGRPGRSNRPFTCPSLYCTNGPAELDSQARALLAKLGIEVRETPLKPVEGKNSSLKLHFSDGRTLDRRALFFHAPRTQSSDLAQQLGCEMSEEGAVAVNAMGQTTVPGVYAAGDLAHPA
jgi:thioredoxin reductase